jgi:sensor domain CHASE-containing protein
VKAARPLLYSCVVFIVFCVFGLLYVQQVEKRRLSEFKRGLTELTASSAYVIQRQLSRSLSATYALSSLIHEYGEISPFDRLASEMIKLYGGISSLQLAPRGIVSTIYPLSGNEEAIGHDLLNDPARRTEALKTIASRQLTLAGPFELVQGGGAVIGRLPVFTHRDTGEEHFWGFTVVLIRLPELLKATNIHELSEKGYAYQLSRIHPDTGEKMVFAGSPALSGRPRVDFGFQVPNGEWTLSVAPRASGTAAPTPIIEYALVSLIGAILALLTFVASNKAVAAKNRTMELSRTNDNLNAEIIERERSDRERERLIAELQQALGEIKTLRGLLPICAYCKKIRDDEGHWHQMEVYIRDHSEADFSHGMCNDCLQEHYPDAWANMRKNRKVAGSE